MEGIFSFYLEKKINLNQKLTLGMGDVVCIRKLEFTGFTVYTKFEISCQVDFYL